MNGENINNGGENLNASEAFKRDIGGVAVENFDLMTQEELDKTAEEAEKTRKALLEQWMKINETTKKIEQEKARREEYNRQKEHAINGTIMDITAWVNTHPNELKEFVHPKLQGGIEKAQKEFEETGTFFNILYASRELTARLAEAEAAAKAAEEILADYVDKDVAPVEAESAEPGVANEESDSEEIVDTTDVEDMDNKEPKPFDVNYPVFNGLDDENLSYPIIDDEKDVEDDDEKNEDNLSYPAEDESDRDGENDEDDEDDTNEAVDEGKNKDEVLDEYVQEVVAQILAGGARELELQRNKQKQATSSETVSAAVDEVIDNKAEQEKNEKVEKIKKKFGLKHGFKKLLMKSQLIKTAVAAAVAVLVTLSIAGDANAVDETRFSKVATEESAGGEISSTDAPDIDSTGVKYGSRHLIS